MEVLVEVLVEVLEVELLGEGRLGAEGRPGRGMGLAGRTRCTSGSRVRESSDREVANALPLTAAGILHIP